MNAPLIGKAGDFDARFRCAGRNESSRLEMTKHDMRNGRKTGSPVTAEIMVPLVMGRPELDLVKKIIVEAQNAGLEVQHEENFRVHYAKTLAGWCHNLEENWDECVAEVGEGTARVWGLYMAGSRMGFERNEIQLHHVLATRTDEDGGSDYPLRHTF